MREAPDALPTALHLVRCSGLNALTINPHPIATTTTPMLVKSPIQSMWSLAADEDVAAKARFAVSLYVVFTTTLIDLVLVAES
mmetsp:Transcript_35559/g.95454  ORF Transcript_35559/g.95454 Transcript_35559/m.95454 type:complete len:83 (+) Transcript_35559:712-960(+)